jgi:RNA polymerase sigma-70 factor (ECF subfamily)
MLTVVDPQLGPSRLRAPERQHHRSARIPHLNHRPTRLTSQRSGVDPQDGADPVGATISGPPADEDRGEFVTRLYAEHRDFMLSFLLRLTGGDRHWAEDVLQETMTRAWRHADQLRSSGAISLRPWLTTVARRIVINNRRGLRVRPQEVDAPLELLPVADETEQALLRTVLVDALKELGTPQRNVVVAMYLRGHSVEEVARLLDIPPGTVKSRSFYALRTLRAVLQERGLGLPA